MSGDLEAVAFEADDLAGGRIAEQHHLAHAEVEQDLRADAILDESLLAGLLAAFIAETLGAATSLFVAAGIIVSLLGLAIMIALPYQQISKLERDYQPRFPGTTAP